MSETAENFGAPAPAVPPLVIRPARRGDIPAITRIYNFSVLHTATTFQIAPETERRRRAWLEAHTDRHPAFVGVAGGVVIGWTALSPYSTREAWARTVEDSIYLDAAHHRRGYGERMLAHLLGEARRLGHRAVVARIVADHAASIGLHRKLGFVEVGRLTGVGFKLGRWHDVVYMERDFGAPAAPVPAPLPAA
ncbi:MAG: GNAT family N-acetyltransferase [Puniceicoccales bacterium]|jgi:phosphinothricin acetyltransferase|nr:GNAT family N-acetyltransferase [Puniceicoccales bacterium]